ncbi:hypothetical protein EW145_g546 [Phellinidium pouzarii]|uniref:RNA-dependent RNA polymerase n=1 Tax=Phellinidium pouzarii TaxID=167371 RepID=A0A4S4LHX8_9AGAM|nr:hypothetical protein EW145_g546 [Phellinidium pouzarii]
MDSMKSSLFGWTTQYGNIQTTRTYTYTSASGWTTVPSLQESRSRLALAAIPKCIQNTQDAELFSRLKAATPNDPLFILPVASTYVIFNFDSSFLVNFDMPPTFLEDLFSVGMRASDQPPQTPPAGRVGDDVGGYSKRYTLRHHLCLETINSSEIGWNPLAVKEIAWKISQENESSNGGEASYWTHDEEFEDLVMQCDEHEENMTDTQTSRHTSPTPGSGSSSLLSSTMISSAATSLNSDSAILESPRRRKRSDSFYGECPRPCLSTDYPPQSRHINITAPGSPFFQRKHIVESPTCDTIIASHARESRQPRPIPRSLCNPGRSPAVTGTSVVTTTGILHSTATTNSASVSTSPTRTNTLNESQLAPFIIAHDKQVQALFDKYVISKGVQFEIARGVTQHWWTWSDITEDKIRQLTGSNAEKAGKVMNIIGTGNPKQTLSPSVIATRQKIYAELDREHLALMEGCERGLGLMGPWQGEDNWFGGRVQLNARLTISKTKDQQSHFSVSLESFGYGKSNRATRYATSLSILQLKIEKDAKWKFKESLIDFLAQRFVICGQLNEDFERRAVQSLGDHFRRSYDTFIRWHNSLEMNKEQPISKWATRWALSLSTSQPVVEFEPQNIYLNIPDVYAEGEEHRTETIMTDGCGFINQSALVLIAKAVNAHCQVLVQGRIAGSKGLWQLHPDLQHRSLDEPPKIWIRDSQIKVKLPPTNEWERSQRIFDLVRIQRLTVPSSLYMQTIQNMSHNGVEDKVFEDLLEAGLKKEIGGLITWEGPNARIRLAKAVENAGGIIGSRLSRLAGSEARLYGYVRDEQEDDGDGEEDTVSGLIERDVLSGHPTRLYESTRELLQAGFSPLENALLRDNLKQIIKNVIDNCLEQYHIPVSLSAEAFIMPDPFGKLKKDQIYFRSTKCINDPMTSTDPYTFNGPVLLTRNPTRVASDIRKVTAVSCDELLAYTDVIIFSTKGNDLGYLGGGDYDGDTVTIIAEPSLVNSFTNSPVVDEPKNLRDRFEREVERVSSFLFRVKDMPVQLMERELCKKLLHGLSESKVGLYSQFHDNAVYYLGYDHPETIMLAYMFTTCLDASKTGLRVKGDVFSSDGKAWNMPRPGCMQKSDEQQRNLMSGYNTAHRSRPKKLGTFVLESLKRSGEALQKAALIEYDNLCDRAERSPRKDPDLVKPYTDAITLAQQIKGTIGVSGFIDELRKVEEFVKGLCDQFVTEVGEHHGKTRSPRKNSRTFSSDSMPSTMSSTATKSKLAAIKHRFAAKFAEGPSDMMTFWLPETAKDIMASYAYHHASGRGGKLAKEFPFAVAHETLCAIKAKKEGIVSSTREFADYTVLHGGLVRSSEKFDDLI